jgi:hypothetical protein
MVTCGDRRGWTCCLLMACKKYMRRFAALPWGRNWAVAGRGLWVICVVCMAIG